MAGPWRIRLPGGNRYPSEYLGVWSDAIAGKPAPTVGCVDYKYVHNTEACGSCGATIRLASDEGTSVYLAHTFQLKTKQALG